MSTLFETYYDDLGHELHIGDIVFFRTKGHLIFGNLVNFDSDKKGNIKYVVTPNPKYKELGNSDLKNSYKVSERNIYLATIKKNN